jgi:hypothetical protein
MMVTWICRSAADKEEALNDILLTYLKSPAFKVNFTIVHFGIMFTLQQENVASKLQCMLLDPKLSSYKDGVLPRAMVSRLGHELLKGHMKSYNSAISVSTLEAIVSLLICKT